MGCVWLMLVCIDYLLSSGSQMPMQIGQLASRNQRSVLPYGLLSTAYTTTHH